MNTETNTPIQDEEIRQSAMTMINRMRPGDSGSILDFIEPELMAAVDKCERRQFGRRFAHLVAKKLLPLKREGMTSQRHNRYTVSHPKNSY